MNNELLNIYNEELAYVRQHITEFNQQHPEIEQDPLVEHLIQAFALCTSKMRYQLEDEYSQISQSLLHLLYPHSLQPFPAAAIAEFTPSTFSDKNSKISANTSLVVKSHLNDYHFKTCFETSLVPWKMHEATLVPSVQKHSCLTLKLQTLSPDNVIDDFIPDNVVFFINASPEYRDAIYTLLYKNLTHITIYNPDNKQQTPLHISCLNFMGFDPTEALVPTLSQTFPGYRLLTEYFNFRDKFYFFNIRLGKIEKGFQQNLHLLFYFDYHDTHLARYIDHANFVLHCTPVVNLFSAHAKPIQLTHQFSDYPLIPENSVGEHQKIYSIDSLSAHTLQQTPVSIHPYFDSHYSDDSATKIYWHPYRLDNQEILLSIIDPHCQLEQNPWILASKITCCNDNDITSINQTSKKTIQLWQQSQEKIESIHFISSITAPIFPNHRHQSHWQLIQSLATDNFQIKEILRLYGTQNNNTEIIDGIMNVTTESITAAHPTLKTRGICHGRKVNITLNESHYKNKSWLPFMLVISEYLRMAAAINQLSQLVVYNQQQEILRCPIKAGV